jgi:hypothetical protein
MRRARTLPRVPRTRARPRRCFDSDEEVCQLAFAGGNSDER